MFATEYRNKRLFSVLIGFLFCLQSIKNSQSDRKPQQSIVRHNIPHMRQIFKKKHLQINTAEQLHTGREYGHENANTKRMMRKEKKRKIKNPAFHYSLRVVGT